MRAYSQQRTVAPAIEPITIREVRDFLEGAAPDEDDDNLLWLFIVAAREACETYTGRSLITQEWEIKYKTFPVGVTLDLLHGPTQSVSELRFYDVNSVATVVDSDTYYLTEENLHGRLTLNYNKQWASAQLRHEDAVEVRYVTGYGDTADTVPMSLKMGMLQYVANLHEHRDQDALTDGVKQKWSEQRLRAYT